jgi:pimeloyl-ACP methyl ester carboxylesterase
MPMIKVNDIQMYYEMQGEGFPLLLIMGLKRNTEWWYRQIPHLSRHFQVIAFDNRGAGRSDKPVSDYSIPLFAADTAGLLDALGILRAHVLGISMGGYIAQELAIRRSDLVQGLVLGCTSCGGPKAVLMSEETRNAYVANEGLTQEQILYKDMHIYFSDEYIAHHPKQIKQFVEISMRHVQPPEAFFRQFNACLGHDTVDRLGDIEAPTLIMAGDDDHLVPTENSRILKELMPGAELHLYPGKRHGFFIEEHEKFNRNVLDFLNSVTTL